jgi:hypothetical protein
MVIAACRRARSRSEERHEPHLTSNRRSYSAEKSEPRSAAVSAVNAFPSLHGCRAVRREARTWCRRNGSGALGTVASFFFVNVL